MKIFILTDLEGVSEVDSIEMIDRTAEDFIRARKALMRDTNIAVDACFSAGAEAVYVLDGHGGGGNFIDGELDTRATQITIAEMSEFAMNGGFDYVVELGAHAMAGTLGGFLDHTQNSSRWFEYKVNGTPLGEVEKHAIFFAAYGIRTVFASGDEALCAEVRRFIPGITAVAVKRAEVRNRATLYGAEVSRERIREGIISALAEPEKAGFIGLKPPYTIELTLYRTDMCEEILEKADPCVRRLSARTIERRVEVVTDYPSVGF